MVNMGELFVVSVSTIEYGTSRFSSLLNCPYKTMHQRLQLWHPRCSMYGIFTNIYLYKMLQFFECIGTMEYLGYGVLPL